MVNTPMGVSPTISAMVYAHFEGSHKLKVYRFTLVLYLIVKIITEEIKIKLENISV